MILSPRPGRYVIDGIPNRDTGGGRNYSFLRLIRRRSATLILRRSLGCGPTRLVGF